MDDVKSIKYWSRSRSKWHIYSFHVLVDAKLEIVSQCGIRTTAAGFVSLREEYGLLSKQTSSGAGWDSSVVVWLKARAGEQITGWNELLQASRKHRFWPTSDGVINALWKQEVHGWNNSHVTYIKFLTVKQSRDLNTPLQLSIWETANLTPQPAEMPEVQKKDKRRKTKCGQGQRPRAPVLPLQWMAVYILAMIWVDLIWLTK